MTKLKSKTALLPEAAKYFKNYPKEEKLHTIGDGNFFLSKDLSSAKSHAFEKKADLITIERSEVEEEKTAAPEGSKGKSTAKDKVQIPEGDPNKDWNKDQLIAYGKEHFKDLKLTKSMNEDTILDKLSESLKAKAEAEAKTAEAGGSGSDDSDAK